MGNRSVFQSSIIDHFIIMRTVLGVFSVVSVLLAGSLFAQVHRGKELPIIADRQSDVLLVPPSETHPAAHLSDPIRWSSDSEDYRVNAAVFDIKYTQQRFIQSVYLAGAFDSIRDVPIRRVAFFDNILDSFSTVGGGIDDGSVYCLLVLSDSDIYAGGNFHAAEGRACLNVAHWDGKTWQPLGTGTDSTVLALAQYDGYIFCGGNFRHAGDSLANYIAAWDPVARIWHPIVDGTVNGTDGGVDAMALASASLLVGGGFVHAGTATVNKIARYTHRSVTPWSDLQHGVSGPNSFVSRIAPPTDALGPNSYFDVCGLFDHADTLAVGNLAQWNDYAPPSWETNRLRFDGPTWNAGAAGTVVGEFSHVNADSYSNFYLVDNQASDGTDGPVYSVAGRWPVPVLVGAGGPIFFGGSFTRAGIAPAHNFAIYFSPYEAVPVSRTQNESLTLWPNPAETEADVKLPDGATSMHVFDALGREVMSLGKDKFYASIATLDVHTLERGSYIIACATPNGIFRSTLLIQR